MDRPRYPSHMRHRRRDPQRTGPIRNVGGAWREDGEWDSARPYDAASRGVSEGYRVIDEQIRRGQRMAQTLGPEDRSSRGRRRLDWQDEEDWRRERRGGYRFLEMPLRQVERLAREILHQIGSGRPNPWRLAELILRLQLETFSELARLGFSALGGFAPRWEDSFEDDVERVGRDIDDSYDEMQDEIEDEEEERGIEPWDWPEAPSTPTTIRSTVPIPIYVSSYEPTEIDLELPAGARSLELEVEAPLISGTVRPARPPFEVELIELADGPAILHIEVPRDLPAGRYRRRILARATGEPVGGLTVQVGTVLPEDMP